MNPEKKHNKHSIRDIEISRVNSPAKAGRVNNPKKKLNKNVVSRKRKKSLGLTFVASVLLLVASVFLLYSFLKPTKATVEIQTFSKNVLLTDDLVHVAYKEAEPGQLGFKVLENNFEKSADIQADKFEYSEDKASGTLTVYNNYSNKPQRIIKNTRFKSPDGKIYRAKKAFTIPGKKSGTPGQVDVKVYADEAGESYNLKSGTKFTLPALSGDAAEGIYAEAKTDIKGGFKGKRASVSEEKKEQVLVELKEALKKEALQKALLKLGPDYISFPDAVMVEFEEPEYSYSQNSANIKLKAKALVPVFNKYDFAREVLAPADAELDFDTGNKIYIDNPEDLELKVTNKDSLDLEEDELLKFTAKGTAVAKYYLDKEAIKKELQGKNETVVRFLKEAYPAIEKINSMIEPVWRDTFPEDPQKIQIVELK